MWIFDKLKFRKKAKEEILVQEEKKVQKEGTKEETAILEKTETTKVTADKKEKIFHPDRGGERAYRVLIRPLITEKTSFLAGANQYVFEVATRENKTEIKKAIKAVYKVNPLKVNIINEMGKWTRYGRTKGKTKDWKKAIVTLRPGEKIEIYEGENKSN